MQHPPYLIVEQAAVLDQLEDVRVVYVGDLGAGAEGGEGVEHSLQLACGGRSVMVIGGWS